MENTNETIQERIVRIAKSYIGQKEIPPNMGFVDPNFDKKMRAIGFQNGWAWCALQSKLIWVEAYADDLVKLHAITHLITPSAMGTFHNFGDAHSEFKLSTEPNIGALAIWQHWKNGERTFQGHVGIVVGVDADGITFETVEGNTSSNLPGVREGDCTAEKMHHLNAPYNPNGLNLVGFILAA